MGTTIKQLELQNFKGTKNLEIIFGEKLTEIFGDNETGKSTILDAFTWLFYGKNAFDKKDFSVKTIKDGKVIHKLKHRVTGLFNSNGEVLKFSRMMSEKWTKKKGATTSELTGHTTIYEINDIVSSATEFNNEILKIADETLFGLITNPMFFQGLAWKERREILFSLVPSVDDQSLLESEEKFNNVLDDILKVGLDKFKATVKSKIKMINQELIDIPARINEVIELTPEAQDFEALEKQKAELTSKMTNNSEILELEQKLKSIRSANALAQEVFETALTKKNTYLATKNLAIQRNETSVNGFKLQIKEKEIEVVELRKEFKTKSAEVFVYDTSGICSHCNQALPSEMLNASKEHAEATFNTNKANDLAAKNTTGQQLGVDIAALKTKVIAFDLKIESDRKEVSELKEIPAAQVLPDAIIVKQLTAARSKAVDSTLIEEIDKKLALKETIEKNNIRKEALIKSETDLNIEKAEWENKEFSCDDFEKKKVDSIEASINEKFTLVSFRLFKINLNGGEEPCCETLVKGVPYADANSAAQINAGIDIINVLSKKHSVNCPIFLDNMESNTNPIETDSQTIHLIVSKPDKVLRIESK